MIGTQEQRAQALETIRETGKQRPKYEHPPEIRAFLNLADIEPIVMPPVDGFAYTVFLTKAKKRSANCPVHINIHGGGFIRPHCENDNMWSAYLADRIGGIVVDLDYTTSDVAEFPVALNQCYEATKWTFASCASWGGNVNRVSVGGYSAGANLAAAVANRAAQTGDFALCLQVLAYAPFDFKTPALEKPDGHNYEISPERGEAFNVLYFGADKALAENPEVSPTYVKDEILAKAPRSLIISASRCNFRFENEDYAIRLASLGVETKVKRFLGCVHGFIPQFAEGWELAANLIVREILDTI